MRFDTLEVKDKTGQTIVLRNAEESDAEDLIKYLRITTGETPFLIREPDEVKLTLEQEKHFITSCIDSERELMLIATINGRHIGNCSLSSIGTYKRYVGSFSGIIVDFIGAIFIKMYTKNIEAAVKFHAKFAESNNLLLANSIANKIEDERLREDTLSEISKRIISVEKDMKD